MKPIATILPGGHVAYALYEDLPTPLPPCACCGKGPVGECPGKPEGAPNDPQRLFAIVRGMVREAPDDKPNGYSEAAIDVLMSAHLAMLKSGPTAPVSGPVAVLSVPHLKAEGEAISALTISLADEARALRLALEEFEAVFEVATFCRSDK